MSVELYALFSYAFTAAIALVMIGAVVPVSYTHLTLPTILRV